MWDMISLSPSIRSTEIERHLLWCHPFEFDRISPHGGGCRVGTNAQVMFFDLGRLKPTLLWAIIGARISSSVLADGGHRHRPHPIWPLS